MIKSPLGSNFSGGIGKLSMICAFPEWNRSKNRGRRANDRAAERIRVAERTPVAERTRGVEEAKYLI